MGIRQSQALLPQSVIPDEGRKLEIGDLVVKSGLFTKKGVVTEINENGGVTVDVSKEALDRYHRHAITTGLTLEEKTQFNSIMDKILGDSPDPKMQVKQIQDTIEQLRTQEGGSVKVPQWLRNEQVKIIRQSGELPDVYTSDRVFLRY